MFNYDSDTNASSFFKDNLDIKSIIVSEGITSIGEYAFLYCNNLQTATLPTTLISIKRNGFMPHIDGYIINQNLYGLTALKIPDKVTELGEFAFAGTAIESVTVLSSVVTVGSEVFGERQNLETVL